MQHAARIYGNVENEIASARELEAKLLLKSAARFQAISEAWDGRKGELDDALLFNRRLWAFFLASIAREDNPLPIDLRRMVAGLGAFVLNRTIRLTGDPRPEGLGVLININRELAAGLRGRV